ncbi:hypothetical protein KKG22_04585 [Patescibacteria group bacterium]|nr:hypothetical protein [Patescibacteria group bacterium]MBU1721614.1 hypothetical protein [Patescibacteria group bacterium]MBU1901724.1 hypothetical protein [Patescibacteria group bacterium]
MQNDYRCITIDSAHEAALRIVQDPKVKKVIFHEISFPKFFDLQRRHPGGILLRLTPKRMWGAKAPHRNESPYKFEYMVYADPNLYAELVLEDGERIFYIAPNQKIGLVQRRTFKYGCPSDNPRDYVETYEIDHEDGIQHSSLTHPTDENIRMVLINNYDPAEILPWVRIIDTTNWD